MRLLAPIRSQSGQGIVEYILVLIVTVALVLGGVYQLNTAFKVWAKSYFGEYIACLLETGDLPMIGGSPGDSGECNKVFKPFSLADGRPKSDLSGPTGGGGGGGGHDSDDKKQKASSGTGGGGSHNGKYNGGAFKGDRGGGAAESRRSRSSEIGKKSDDGNLGTSNYGANSKRQDGRVKNRLDNRFAFETQKEADQRRTINSISAQRSDDEVHSKIRIHRNDHKKDDQTQEDSEMTFGNFMRYLVIAAIIIALVVLLGGQMLQVSKSME